MARAEAALGADYLDRLLKIDIPTLIIPPSHDTLIGRQAASENLEAIHILTGIALVYDFELQQRGHSPQII